MDKFSIRFTFEGKEYQATVDLVPVVKSSTGYPEYQIYLEDEALISRFTNKRVITNNYSFLTCSFLPVPGDEIFMHSIIEALVARLNQPETFS